MKKSQEYSGAESNSTEDWSAEHESDYETYTQEVIDGQEEAKRKRQEQAQKNQKLREKANMQMDQEMEEELMHDWSHFDYDSVTTTNTKIEPEQDESLQTKSNTWITEINPEQSRYPEWYEINKDAVKNINDIESVNLTGQKELWTWEKSDGTKEQILLWYRESEDSFTWISNKTYYIELNNSWSWSDTRIEVSWDLVNKKTWKINQEMLEKALSELKNKE